MKLAAAVIVSLVLGFTAGWLAHAEKPVRERVVVVTPSPEPVEYDPHSALTADNCFIKLNEARLSNGMPQLEVGTSTAMFASERAAYLDGPGVEFSHAGFVEAVNSHRFPGQTLSELITKADTCQKAVDNFLNSPTHKDGLLHQATSMSVGVSGRTVVVIIRR